MQDPRLDLLPLVQTLAAVSKSGGIRAAAARLGISKSTVSRQLKALEDALGLRLVTRSSRSLALTTEGRYLIERFEPVRDAWGDTLEALRTLRDAPHGHIRISAPHIVAHRWLPRLMSDFQQGFRDVTIDVIPSDHVLDLVEDNIHVAIRTAPLPDSSLRALKLVDARETLLASPALVARLGLDPEHPETIDVAPWVLHTPFIGLQRVLSRGDREHRFAPDRFTEARSSEFLVSLTLQGLGVAVIPDRFVSAELTSGALVDLGWYGRDTPLYAVFPDRALAPRRVDVFIDRLREEFLDGNAGTPS